MSDVSRETSVEPEPGSAPQLVGDGLARVRLFAHDLVEHGERLGLLGPLELPRLWSRHILNSALLAPLLRTDGDLVDVGSGAGLPGIVLASVRPDVAVTLIEPMERRVAWLESEAERLGLRNLRVVRARAEEFRPRRSFGQVTARAVSALRTLIPITAPLARPGGELLLLKGARVDDEVVAAGREIAAAHLVNVRVEVLGRETAPEETRLFRATVK